MKKLLTAFLLLFTTPILAQNSPLAGKTVPSDSAGLAALDAKYGWRKFIFGAPLESFPDMQKRGKHFIDPLELREVGTTSIEIPQFYFYENKLCGILLSTNGTNAPTALFNMLVAQYGTPRVLNDSQWAWIGKRVTMTYTQTMLTANFGHVGIPVKNATVWIETNEALARRKATQKMGLYGSGL